MVSFYQMGTQIELSKEGWHDVAPPYDVDKTRIGGPATMMNHEGDVIRVFPDGSVALLGPVKVMQGGKSSMADIVVEKARS